jgi:hypothetical protein
MKGKLPIALVATALVTMLLAAPGSLVHAQPVASITLPAPGATKQLYPACNNISLTFPDGTASETVIQAVTPAGAVEAMWRHNAALNRFEGFSPTAPQASDLLTVNFLDAVWLCMAAIVPSLTGPPPQIAPPPVGASPTSSPTVAPTPIPSPTAPSEQEMSLGQAISNGVVDARITGTGGSSGDAIMLGLTRRTAADVQIDLPTGTLLVASSSAFQNMAVRGVKGEASSQHSITYVATGVIVLTQDGEQWFVVEAYCLGLYLENPGYSTDFSVGGLASPQVVQVLEAAGRLQPQPSVAAVQLAVWAVSEDSTAGEVTSRFEADQSDFSQARAILVEAGIDPNSRRMFQ